MYVDISNIQTNVNGCKLPLLTSVVCFLFCFFGGGGQGGQGQEEVGGARHLILKLLLFGEPRVLKYWKVNCSEVAS